jgi:hypothetical protein
MALQRQDDTYGKVPLEYNETSQPTWSNDDEHWIVDGPNRWRRSIICPQCREPFPVTYALIFKSVIFKSVNVTSEWMDVYCRCETAHQPHNAGEGCGWYGQVLFTPPPKSPHP